jgi:hypothetical protein
MDESEQIYAEQPTTGIICDRAVAKYSKQVQNTYHLFASKAGETQK